MVELCEVVDIARCGMVRDGRRREGWIVLFIPVRGEIYHSTISSTDCLCGGGTSDSKHV